MPSGSNFLWPKTKRRPCPLKPSCVPSRCHLLDFNLFIHQSHVYQTLACACHQFHKDCFQRSCLQMRLDQELFILLDHVPEFIPQTPYAIMHLFCRCLFPQYIQDVCRNENSLSNFTHNTEKAFLIHTEYWFQISGVKLIPHTACRLLGTLKRPHQA